MTSFVDRNAVADFLEDAGGTIISVRFLKVDGTERRLIGRFGDPGDNPTPLNQRAAIPLIEQTRDPETGLFLPVDENRWRSFRSDRVLSIRNRGEELSND